MPVLADAKLLHRRLKSAKAVSNKTKLGNIGTWDIECKTFGFTDERRSEILDGILAKTGAEKMPYENLGYLRTSATVDHLPLGSAIEYVSSLLIEWLQKDGGATPQEMHSTTIEMLITPGTPPAGAKPIGRAGRAIARKHIGSISAHSQMLSNSAPFYTYGVTMEVLSKDDLVEPVTKAADFDTGSTSSAPSALAMFCRANIDALNNLNPVEITVKARPTPGLV